MTNVELKNFRLGIFIAVAGTALFSLKSIIIKLAFQEGIDATTLLSLRINQMALQQNLWVDVGSGNAPKA